MITTYIRSSSYGQWDYCQQAYFLTYVLGYQSTSGKAAILGTVVHKVMEVLAGLKKYQQDNTSSKILSLNDSAIGQIDISKNRLLTKGFVNELIDLSYANYTKDTDHSFSKADKETCVTLTNSAISFNNGQFDPRLRNVIDPEPHFDLEIMEDWAKYEFDGPDGQKISGRLSIKGTIDLVTQVSDDIIEVVDWKGLPIETKIPTPQGFSTMGDIKVGDVVFDQYGMRCNVVGKSRVNTKPCYRICFDDTTSVVCDNEHLWKLSNGDVRDVQSLTIGDKINVAQPIQCVDIDLPIHPYLLGVWLGDGRSRSCEITGEDLEIFDKIESLGFSLGVDSEKRKNKIQTRTVLGQTLIFRELGLLGNKHIPEIYFRASYSQRLELLHGLMDTDGNANPARKQAVFTSCDKRLSDDVKHLLLTLGQRPYQAIVKKDTNFRKGVVVYPLSFRPININPFYLSRKRAKIDPAWGYGNSAIRKVIKIESVAQRQTQCISVDSDDNTYLCTESYIPTHNTGRRVDWATGEEKTPEKLKKDPQLLLYNYAISRLYPQYKQAILSIFFIKDGGPFSMCFDESDRVLFLEMLRKRFEQIRDSIRPKLLSPNQSHWKCQKLCHFYKNNWPGTNQSMCSYVHEHIKTHGIEKTIDECKHPEHRHDYYSAPG